jgi:hypothetical protein
MLRSPITGVAGCCARAASGHTAAAPPRHWREFYIVQDSGTKRCTIVEQRPAPGVGVVSVTAVRCPLGSRESHEDSRGLPGRYNG